MSDYEFSQVIDAPTRITKNSQSCINLIFTNVEAFTSGVAVVSVADHLMNYLIMGSSPNYSPHRYIFTRKLNYLD